MPLYEDLYRSRYKTYAFQTSALDVVLGDLQVLGTLSPRDDPTDEHFIAGRMVPKARLGRGKENVLLCSEPFRNQTSLYCTLNG
jgi:hypothetical protein